MWILRGMTTEPCDRPNCGGQYYFHITEYGKFEKKCILCSRVKDREVRIANKAEKKEARYGWHNK